MDIFQPDRVTPATDQPQPQAAPSAAYDPMQDPRFLAFVKQRADQINELRAAQQQAADTRNSTGFRVGSALTAFGGGDVQQRYDRANQPVADVLQRQKAADALTDSGTKDLALQDKFRSDSLGMQAADPGSAISQRMRPLLAKLGYSPDDAARLSASDVERAISVAKAGGDIHKALGEAAQARAAAGKSQAETPEVAPDAASKRALEAAQAQKAQAEAAMAHLKPVPEAEASKIVNMAQSLKAIDELEKMHGDVGGSAYIPGVNAGAEGRYKDAINALSGAVAAGALPAAKESPALMEEFKKSFPLGMHGAGRAKAFFDHLRDQVRSNANGQIESLRGGMYSPEQLKTLSDQVSGASGAKSGNAHPQDAEAVQWAKSNPNDPRAAQILKLNGAQ